MSRTRTVQAATERATPSYLDEDLRVSTEGELPNTVNGSPTAKRTSRTPASKLIITLFSPAQVFLHLLIMGQQARKHFLSRRNSSSETHSTSNVAVD